MAVCATIDFMVCLQFSQPVSQDTRSWISRQKDYDRIAEERHLTGLVRSDTCCITCYTGSRAQHLDFQILISKLRNGGVVKDAHYIGCERLVARTVPTTVPITLRPTE